MSITNTALLVLDVGINENSIIPFGYLREKSEVTQISRSTAAEILQSLLQILEMNYESRIIRLARMDYLNNLCPQHHANASINHDVLLFLQDTELGTFYHDCQSTVDVHPNDYIKYILYFFIYIFSALVPIIINI